MKKFLILLLAICLCLSMGISIIGCSNSNNDNGSNNNSNINNSFNWSNAGKGTGAYVPEPTKEYEINASSDYISVEVHEVTEEDFYSYVSRCELNGFNGNVGTATSPDIYFFAEHTAGYELKVYFYEDDAYFSIYAAPKSN